MITKTLISAISFIAPILAETVQINFSGEEQKGYEVETLKTFMSDKYLFDEDGHENYVPATSIDLSHINRSSFDMFISALDDYSNLNFNNGEEFYEISKILFLYGQDDTNDFFDDEPLPIISTELDSDMQDKIDAVITRIIYLMYSDEEVLKSILTISKKCYPVPLRSMIAIILAELAEKSGCSLVYDHHGSSLQIRDADGDDADSFVYDGSKVDILEIKTAEFKIADECWNFTTLMPFLVFFQVAELKVTYNHVFQDEDLDCVSRLISSVEDVNEQAPAASFEEQDKDSDNYMNYGSEDNESSGWSKFNLALTKLNFPDCEFDETSFISLTKVIKALKNQIEYLGVGFGFVPNQDVEDFLLEQSSLTDLVVYASPEFLLSEEILASLADRIPEIAVDQYPIN